ncbi:GbpC/Spa domain-containing protein [Streptococcus sp. SI1]|uniref:GbpC/Spa domain-containing protein n=1 Tax=Streptococcus sp. SI1 TaxID=3018245 RepID=UPI00263C572D|nr:GbpC/Spa domain-containing protein [Streptococcus sp. SI1]MDN5016694.1 GbpC/Spa domain-containing protein [Streptococcus sp. SI1]
MQKKMKEYGSIRKLKAYGACGVLLGMSALMLATADVGLADEVVSAPKQEVASAAQSNNVVDHSVVDKAVAKAQAAGIKTIQDPTVDKGTVTTPSEATKVKQEIAKNYEAQAAAIDKTTEDYAQKKAAYEKAIAETKKNNEQIAAENQALKEAHEKAVQASKETNQAVEEAKAKIKKQFPDAKVTETTKEIPVDPTKSAYDRYTKVVEQVQAENKKATETYQAEKTKEDKEIAETKAYNEAVRKRNAEGKAKVEAENKEIDDFNRKVAEHNKAEDERFEKEKAQAEANKTKKGWLPEVIKNRLLFNQETVKNAEILDSEGIDYFNKDKFLKIVDEKHGDNHAVLRTDLSHLSSSKQEGTDNNRGVFGRMKVGQTAKITYGNLNVKAGDKIATKAVFEYTVVSTPNNQGYINAVFWKNPVRTIDYGAVNDNGQDSMIRLRVRLYDKDGNEIKATKENPWYYSAASLNSSGAGSTHIEYVKTGQGTRFLKINGSYVDQHVDGIYSATDIDYGNVKTADWDIAESPNAYYGAGVMEVSDTIELTFGVKTSGNSSAFNSAWFVFNTDIKAAGVPVAPNYKTPKEHKIFTPESEKEVPTPKAKLNLVKVNPVPAPTFKPKEADPIPPEIPTIHYHHVQLKVEYKMDKSVLKTPAPALPQTGEHSSTGLMALGLSLLAAFGLVGLKKRKENQ